MSVYELGKHALGARHVLCMGLMFLSTSQAQAGPSGITLNVHCGASSGLNSIGAALKVLQHSETSGPSTINVSGVCNEDVVIQGMDRVTLNAVNGASINDPSSGNNPTLSIIDSRTVTVTNFVISGYAPGTSGNDVVDCARASICRFNGNTVQNAPQGAGIGVYSGSYADIEGGLLQKNTGWAGLAVAHGARALAIGVTLQGNWRGAVIYDGAHLQFANSTSTANTDLGFMVRQGATLICQGCTVTLNGSEGVHFEENSVGSFVSNFSVTGNAGAGVSVSNGSNASFLGGGNATNNNGGQGDVVCNPHYTTVAGSPDTVGTIVGCP